MPLKSALKKRNPVLAPQSETGDAVVSGKGTGAGLGVVPKPGSGNIPSSGSGPRARLEISDDSDEDMYAPPTSKRVSSDPTTETKPEIKIKQENEKELKIKAELIKAAGFEPQWFAQATHVNDDDVIYINDSDDENEYISMESSDNYLIIQTGKIIYFSSNFLTSNKRLIPFLFKKISDFLQSQSILSEDGRNEQSEPENEQSEPENEQSEPENEQSECDLDVEILEYRRREEDKVKYIDIFIVNYE